MKAKKRSKKKLIKEIGSLQKQISGLEKLKVNLKDDEEELKKYPDNFEEKLENRTAAEQIINKQLRHEIIQRKLLEQALQVTATRYKRLFETTKEGILILDGDTGQIIDVNPYLIEMLGYSHEEFLKKKFWEVGAFKDIEASKTILSDLKVQKTLRYENLPLETKNGEFLEVEFICNIYQVNTKKLIQCNIRDIARRREADDLLLISEARYRNLFASAQDGILILDADTGQIVDVNPFLIRLLGYSKKEFLGKKLWEIGPFKDIQACRDAFLKLQTDDYVRYEDLPLETKNGKAIDVEFVSNVYLVDHKRVIQCNIRDISERRRIERIKEGIVRTVAHELRNPLAIVKEGVSVVFQKIAGDLNENQEEMLALVSETIDRLIRVTNDLLDISKFETGRVELKKAPVDIPELIDDVVSLFEHQARKKGLELKVRSPERKANVCADKDKLFQILTNLVGNAVKFTEKGFIEISVAEEENYIEIAVTDTGRGINKDDLPSLFTKFKQFGAILGGPEKGAGLGLCISKEIIELHKGEIWVESEPGRGSKFIFTLPKGLPRE